MAACELFNFVRISEERPPISRRDHPRRRRLPECRYYPAVISPTIAAHSFPWYRHSHFVRKWQRFAVALSAVPEIPLMPERKGSCSPSAIESVHPDHSMHCESISAKSGANCDARCTELTHGERCINRATPGRGRECRSRRCWIARNVESRERGETMAGPTAVAFPPGTRRREQRRRGRATAPRWRRRAVSRRTRHRVRRNWHEPGLYLPGVLQSEHGLPLSPENVLGVLSLIAWALILVAWPSSTCC